MPDNLFQELRDVLVDFRQFLDDNVGTIRPAIQALAGLIPQVADLIGELVTLMNSVKEEVQNLDVSAIPGLAEATQFTGQVSSFLDSANALLPDQAEAIGAVRQVADVVGSLDALDGVRDEIVATIDAINAHLESLRPS